MTIQSNNNMDEKTNCPKCKNSNIIKWTKRKTENRGLIQRYKCKDCGKTFTFDDGFFRMRNAPQKITCAIDLFYRGVSTRKVQEHFQAFYPHNSSHKSIYKWVIKYSKAIAKFTSKLKISIGEEVQVDEVEMHRRKSHTSKQGVDENWFIDSIDTKTRFMVASNYCKARGQKEIKEVMKAIKYKTESQARMITTDGLTSYPKTIKSIWGYNLKQGKYNMVHNQVNASKGEGFNHPIERLHNNIRQRTKVMRGFHGSVASANAIMKGFEVYYNFVTKHQGIDCCPYELAIPELKEKLNVPNKWLSLILMANNQNH